MKQAAEVLGISSEGVRKRIKRGNLGAEKDSDGKVYVWLDTDRTSPDGDRTDGKTNSEDDRAELLLRDQVEYLRGQLEIWQEESRRKDHIIAALTERIPEIEAPRNDTNAPAEPRESPVGRTEEPEKGETHPGEERRSWWRRFLYGP